MKELFKNCIDVIEEDGWLLPVRFTQKQFLTYNTDAFSTRAHSPSSVCLAFKTAAKRISFKYKIGTKARAWALVDLKCDGVLIESVSLLEDTGRVEFLLSGDATREYRIYLPHLVVFYLCGIESDAPLIPVCNRKKFWLALGDSITQGMDAKHPSFSYPSIVADWFSFDVLNLGVGGACFNAQNLDEAPKNPDIVTVALGTNDWGISRDTLISNVTEYMDKVVNLYTPAHLYVILPIWRSDANNRDANGMNFDDQRETILGAVSKYPNVKLIDGYGILPRLAELYGEVGDRRKVHPTDEGFAHMALGIIKTFLKDGIENENT